LPAARSILSRNSASQFVLVLLLVIVIEDSSFVAQRFDGIEGGRPIRGI
jgi:hypothetical protein